MPAESRLPRRALSVAALIVASVAGSAHAETLLQDTFSLGQRPGNGRRPDDIAIGSNLNGKRAEVPGTAAATWITNSPGASWAFSASSSDPFEAPSPGGANGTVSYEPRDENPPLAPFAVALLDFTAPTGAFQESADWASGAGDLAIGFTSSIDVSGDTFGQFGLFALDLRTSPTNPGLGAWTLTTADGGQLSGTTVITGFNRLAISYDPLSHLVQGSVNGVLTGSLPDDVTGIAGVGFQGVGGVNNFQVNTGALGTGIASVPEPMAWTLMVLGFGGLGGALRRRKAALA